MFLLLWSTFCCAFIFRSFAEKNRALLLKSRNQIYSRLDELSVVLQELLDTPTSFHKHLETAGRLFNGPEPFLRAYVKLKTSYELEDLISLMAGSSGTTDDMQPENNSLPSNEAVTLKIATIPVDLKVSSPSTKDFDSLGIGFIVEGLQNSALEVASIDLLMHSIESNPESGTLSIQQSPSTSDKYRRFGRLKITNFSREDMKLIHTTGFLAGLMGSKALVHRLIHSKPHGHILAFDSKERGVEMKAKIEDHCNWAIVDWYEEPVGDLSETLDIYGIPEDVNSHGIIDIFTDEELKEIQHIEIPNMSKKCLRYTGGLRVAFKDKDFAKKVRERLDGLYIGNRGLTATFTRTIPPLKDMLIGFDIIRSKEEDYVDFMDRNFTSGASFRTLVSRDGAYAASFFQYKNPVDATKALQSFDRKNFPRGSKASLFRASGSTPFSDHEKQSLPLIYEQFVTTIPLCQSTLRSRLRDDGEGLELKLTNFPFASFPDLGDLEANIERAVGSKMQGYCYFIKNQSSEIQYLSIYLADMAAARRLLSEGVILLSRVFRVSRFGPRQHDERPSAALTISGINRSVTGREIFDLFASFGPVQYLNFLVDINGRFVGQVSVVYYATSMGSIVYKALKGKSIVDGVALNPKPTGLPLDRQKELIVFDWKVGTDISNTFGDLKHIDVFALSTQQILILKFASSRTCETAQFIIRKRGFENVLNFRFVPWPMSKSVPRPPSNDVPSRRLFNSQIRPSPSGNDLRDSSADQNDRSHAPHGSQRDHNSRNPHSPYRYSNESRTGCRDRSHVPRDSRSSRDSRNGQDQHYSGRTNTFMPDREWQSNDRSRKY